MNLAAAILALWLLKVAARPPDDEHSFGHDKAEYFASGIEGTFILAAAAGIAVTAVPRLLHPEPLEQVGWGLAVSAVAALVNLVVGQSPDPGREGAPQHHARSRRASPDDGRVDVCRCHHRGGARGRDGLAALRSADRDRGGAHICLTGVRLDAPVRERFDGHAHSRRRSATACRPSSIAIASPGVDYHALRTRQAGHRRFVYFHLLVPGAWSVEQGHNLMEGIEGEIRASLPYATVIAHLEPVEDPSSYQDLNLDR